MRSDGIKLKNVDPMYKIGLNVMAHRHDAMNMITLNIPIDPLQKYIRVKAEEGVTISHMGILLAAYVRTIAEFPQLNRFIINRTAYAHKDITVSMVVLKSGSVEDETMSKIHLNVTDTIFDVQNKVDGYITENRKVENSNGTDKIINTLVNTPGILRGGVKLLKWMDKHGWMPKSIIEVSPFHASLLVTNLASIRTNHIYHHIYDFGSTSLSLAIGTIREVLRRTPEGNVVTERCIPLGLVMDERIAAGSYFARAFRVFKRNLKNPALLETPPTVIHEDPWVRKY